MRARDYFPLGKAQERAFCNRSAELQWLIETLQASKHPLVVAPRRFGKSSLAERAITISHWPSVSLNFNTCSDEGDVEQLIRHGVGRLIGYALGPVEKLVNSIKHYVGNITPKLNLGAEYIQLELTLGQQKTSAAANVEEVLTLIEKLLTEKKQRAVLLFDEFQTVGLIAKGHGVEAAIRNVAQQTKYLSIIFSGSSRSLLMSMFENSNRPLYKLCRKLHLTRIEAIHYRKHLNQAARIAWGIDLETSVFERIMELSERHPYYVNYLCDVIWTETANAPQLADVNTAWGIVLEEEQSDVSAEIMTFSPGQKKILRQIVNHQNDGLMSAHTTAMTGMAVSSLAGAITALVEKDIIEKQVDGYKIINPVLMHLLKE